MTNNNMTPIDRSVLFVSTGLMLLSVVVLGLVEVVTGPPFGPVPMETEAGHTLLPTVPPFLRTGLFVLALVILLLWAIYKLAQPGVAE